MMEAIAAGREFALDGFLTRKSGRRELAHPHIMPTKDAAEQHFYGLTLA